MQLPVLWPVSVSTRTLTSQGIGFLETLKNPANLFKNNLDNTRNNIKSEIPPPPKKNGGIVELLIPAFPKKSFSWGDKNFFGQKNYGEMVLNWRRINDQIMSRFGRSFIKDKCIFQQANFLYIDSHLGYWYIICKGNTRNRGMNLRNTLFALICLYA